MSTTSTQASETGFRTVASTDRAKALRIKRAATHSMKVGSYNDAPGMFRVYNEAGHDYVVDIIEKTCTCPDHVNRSVICKHVYRAEMHIGVRDIPEDVHYRCDARIMREAAIRRKEAKQARQDAREEARIEREAARAASEPIEPDYEPEEVATDGGWEQ